MTYATTDEQAIADLDARWGDAASRSDVDAVVPFYAADGSLVWPGQAAVHGTEGIRAAWTAMVKEFPNLSLRFTPERIVVSASGDLATDFGRVDLAYDGKAGRESMTAKYLVAWRREGGEWKVLYDSWNDDGAAAPAAPTA